MGKLMEFNCVAYLSNTKANEEAEKYRELGIKVSKEETKEERIIKYSFDVSNIVEIRETFVSFKDEWMPAVSVSFIMTKGVVSDTPPLCIEYEEFKRKIDEYNKESSQTR